MSSEQLSTRILAEQSRIRSNDIRRGKVTEEEINRYIETSRNIYNLPLFIDETPAITIATLSNRARRIKRLFGLSLIVVDYIQLMRSSSNKNEGRVQEISEITQLSVGMIEQEISSYPGLTTHRKELRMLERRSRYRNVIMSFILESPKASITKLKKTHSKEYYWLYLYDRDWLKSNQPRRLNRYIPKRVNWTQRDSQTALKVEKILRELNMIVSRTRLDKLLGAHGWLTKYKDKMPRSILTLEKFNAQIEKKSA